MSENLQDQQFFHGTSSFEPAVGSKILPPKKSGAQSYWGHLDDNPEYGQSVTGNAYATTDESTAWVFAEQRSGEPGSMARPAVYRVKPNGPFEPGIETSSHEVRSPYGFAVTERIDTQPGHQGTIPSINWAQHAKYLNPFDANHPYDDYPEVPTTRAYPYQLEEASDNYVRSQSRLRKATETGQDELFDSTPHRVDPIVEKGAAMVRFSRGEIDEQGMPETRKFPYYPRKGA